MLKVIIVDDEVDIVKYLELLIAEYCTNVKVIGTAYSVPDAIQEIESKSPDAVLLDITFQGTELTGFDVLDNVSKRNFAVIFISAYEQFAMKAIRYSAVDYILKPIDIELLKESFIKVEQVGKIDSSVNIKRNEVLLENYKQPVPKKLALFTKTSIIFVDINDIIFIESEGNNSKVYIQNRDTIFTNKNLRDYQELLESSKYYRPHISYLVNMDHVKEIEKSIPGRLLMSNNIFVPIARGRTREVTDLLLQFHITN